MVPTEPAPPPRRSGLHEDQPRLLRQLLLPVLVLGAMVLLGHLGSRYFTAIEQWIGDLGWFGAVVFSLVYVLLVVFCFPVSVLGFSAGALFGFTWGAVLLLGNGVVTGCVIFLLARRFGHRRIAAYVAARPRLAAFERLARAQSLRLMLLLRLSPLNFGVVCYVLGAGRIRFSVYLLGLLAIMPSAIAQSYFGHATRRLSQAVGGQGSDVSRLQDLWTAVGLVACIVLMAVLGTMTRKALREAATENDGGT